jgi:serine/threonine-protein kinase
MIDPSGNVTTLAGNGTYGFADGTGGPAGTAEFAVPWGLAVDGDGNVIVADYGNSRIRVIDPWGNVSTLAGNGKFGFADGTGGADGGAEFAGPQSLALDCFGDVYVADTFNNRVRMVDPSGQVSTVAGNGTEGFADGAGGPDGVAEFDNPCAVAADGNGDVFVSDYGNDRIRRIDPWGRVSTLAGSGVDGFADGACATAQFHHQEGLTLGERGTLYVADWGNNRVRAIRVDP